MICADKSPDSALVILCLVIGNKKDVGTYTCLSRSQALALPFQRTSNVESPRQENIIQYTYLRYTDNTPYVDVPLPHLLWK